MFIPSAFVSSTANREFTYDAEGRMHPVHVGSAPDGDGGIAEANSLYATQSEMFSSCAPFLRKNKLADAKRRNYVIQPGGAALYFKTEKKLADIYNHGRVQYSVDFPAENESFGHNSNPGPRPIVPSRPPSGGTFRDPFSR